MVVNIMCSGMLERFPELKVVSVESGAGWIPFLLEALDYEMSENAPVVAAVAAVGEDNLMFETEFPHPTCLYPDPLKTAAANMEGLSPTAQRKILGENAVRLYQL